MLRAFLFGLSAVAANALPASEPGKCKPPAFFLAGDSTTAVQSAGGGGWGDGFLRTLRTPAWGVNKGHNGATTVSFVQGGDWATILEYVRNSTQAYDVYVTIQFGHNDQKPAKNITMEAFKSNLQTLARNVKDAGGKPLIFTSLTRRNFNETGLKQDLADVVAATHEAAEEADLELVDLNAASRKYVAAIGSNNADKYNLVQDDGTHLNSHGSDVFGRIVADLLLQKHKSFGQWITRNESLSTLIRDGVYA